MNPLGLPAEALRALRILPVLGDRLDEVAAHTSVLEGIKDDVARIEEDVRSIPAIETRVANVEDLMSRLITAIEELNRNVGALQQSMEPVGRLADRLPGSSPRD